MKKSNMKTPLVFKIGMALLFVLIFSFTMTGGLYARYSTSAYSNDSARVATFAFSDDFDSVNTEFLPITSMKPGDRETFSIEVTNTGETALRYYVKIENLTKNLPVCKDEILYEELILPPGDQTDTLRFTVEWDNTKTSVDFAGKMDLLKITIVAEQYIG